MHRHEPDAGVESVGRQPLRPRVDEETEAAPQRLVRHVAARAHHLLHGLGRDDASGGEGLPERVHVGGRRVDAAIAAPANGEMEHVRPQAVVGDVTDRRPARKFVRTQERCVVHAGRGANTFLDEVVERRTGGALRDERQHDVSAVAVRESFIRWELRRMTAEDAHVVLGRRQLVAGDRHHVLVGVGEDVLVEIVADARAVGEQMFHGDAIVDQREVVAEHRPRRRVEVEFAALDQRHDRQRGEPLCSAGDAELCRRRVRDAEPTMGHTGRTLERDASHAVDAHGSRESMVGHDPFERVLQSVFVHLGVRHGMQRAITAPADPLLFPPAGRSTNPQQRRALAQLRALTGRWRWWVNSTPHLHRKSAGGPSDVVDRSY